MLNCNHVSSLIEIKWTIHRLKFTHVLKMLCCLRACRYLPEFYRNMHPYERELFAQ